MQFYKLPKFDGVNARAVRAWREYYIDYRALKRLLDMYDNLQVSRSKHIISTHVEANPSIWSQISSGVWTYMIYIHHPSPSLLTSHRIIMIQQKIMRNLPIAGVTKRQPTDELPTSIAIPELQSNNTYIDMRLAYIGKQLSTYPIEEQEQVCSEVSPVPAPWSMNRARGKRLSNGDSVLLLFPSLSSTQAFAQLFTQDIDKCNAFYIHETRRLANEYDELYMDICRVQRALKKMQRHKDCPLEISRIWSHIRALCKSIHA